VHGHRTPNSRSKRVTPPRPRFGEPKDEDRP
jgi:hypothetical protein